MLRTVEHLRGLKIRATDDEIGKVDEFFFDDERWTIRYMVVDTGNWLISEPVLISPRSVREVDWDDRRVEVSLTREQVKEAPSIASDRPVSRQMELEHAAYYNYDPYWYGPGLWGGTGFPYYAGGVAGYTPVPLAATEREREIERDRQRDIEGPQGDSHLRSTREVHGYHIRANDGEIGHVTDFVMDDETWAMRYFVIDTRNWWPGKKVLLAPAWVDAVNWGDRTVDVDLPREAIKSAPEYDPERLTREYEADLYSHYGRPSYWDEAPRR